MGYRALTWAKLGKALMETLKLSVMILFIIAASQTFAPVLSFSGATGGLIRAIESIDPRPLRVPALGTWPLGLIGVKYLLINKKVSRAKHF